MNLSYCSSSKFNSLSNSFSVSIFVNLTSELLFSSETSVDFAFSDKTGDFYFSDKSGDISLSLDLSLGEDYMLSLLFFFLIEITFPPFPPMFF